MFPNPTEQEKNCKIVLNTMPEKELSIQVYDVNGIVQYETKLTPESSTIEIPTYFAKGIYLVKVSCDEFTKTKRLMIKD